MIAGTAYAWTLDIKDKPSPECKRICVRLVPVREYDRLKKLAKP